MWANFSDPHHPWNADSRYRPEPKGLTVPGYLPDLPRTRQQLADYLAEINRLDERVGQVLEVLRKHRVYEQTIIVFA